MKFRIKHISFLQGEDRAIAKCTINGKFLAKGKYFDSPSARASAVTALSFTTLPGIINNDPVLTLHDGSKMRVYLGGDSFYMVVETQSIMEVHDKEAEEYAKRKLEKKKPEPKKSETYAQSSMFGDIDIFEDLQEW